MLRTSDGWRIKSLTQHVGWSDGNKNAVTEATARVQTKQAGA
jgi:hypothetical protein